MFKQEIEGFQYFPSFVFQLLDLLDIHPISFIQLVRPTLEFVVTYNFSLSEKGKISFQCPRLDWTQKLRYPIRMERVTLLTCWNCWGYALLITGLLFERFSVNCFNLMRGILSSDVYRPMKSPGMNPNNDKHRQTSRKLHNSDICFHQSHYFCRTYWYC